MRRKPACIASHLTLDAMGAELPCAGSLVQERTAPAATSACALGAHTSSWKALDLLQAREAETRLEYAVHYGIPYPRLHHAPQFPKRYVLEKPQMPDGPQHATGCAPELPPSLQSRRAGQSVHVPAAHALCTIDAPTLARMRFKFSCVAGRRITHESPVTSVGQNIDQRRQSWYAEL